MNQTEKRKQWFSETEKLLRLYWQRCLQLERLQAQLKVRKDEVAGLLQDWWSILGSQPSIISKYGYQIPGPTGYQSGYEEMLVKKHDSQEAVGRKIKNKEQAIAKLESRIARLREANAPIETMVKKLSKDECTILESRYVYRRSNYQIAGIIHYSEPTVRRMFSRAVWKVADWMGKLS